MPYILVHILVLYGSSPKWIFRFFLLSQEGNIQTLRHWNWSILLSISKKRSAILHVVDKHLLMYRISYFMCSTCTLDKASINTERSSFYCFLRASAKTHNLSTIYSSSSHVSNEGKSIDEEINTYVGFNIQPQSSGTFSRVHCFDFDLTVERLPALTWLGTLLYDTLALYLKVLVDLYPSPNLMLLLVTLLVL